MATADYLERERALDRASRRCSAPTPCEGSHYLASGGFDGTPAVWRHRKHARNSIDNECMVPCCLVSKPCKNHRPTSESA
jgi:hypothetical protein